MIAGQQAVLFYLDSPELIALPEHLHSGGAMVPSITHPESGPGERFVLRTRDGYTLLIGQAG